MADADAIVVGAGLAGLVAATELADAGKRILVVDQEPRENLGGQAFWSLGALFIVDSPEQRRFFVVRDDLESLVAGMNAITGENLLDPVAIRREIDTRDRALANSSTKDSQIMGIRSARRYLGDRLVRTAKPHALLDPRFGPLIAVRLNILTRKTLGGFETDLDGRVFGRDGEIVPGLFAACEASGFGRGGMHGYRSLEGTFLGGCLFSGRQAGRAAARGS